MLVSQCDCKCIVLKLNGNYKTIHGSTTGEWKTAILNVSLSLIVTVPMLEFPRIKADSIFSVRQFIGILNKSSTLLVKNSSVKSSEFLSW